MWKIVLDCHHKQFLVVVESKVHDLVPKTGVQRTASKVTRELEMELLNWCFCFSNWISTQRDYVEALNGWLVKWLIQEKEETTDGVAPFSPGRMGASPVFVTANDWYHAIERVSEIGVIDAMQAFAINVHGLWERQDEEQKQKLKADYMSKDFARRIRSLQKENGMDRPFDLDKTVVSITSNNDPFHDRLRALDALKKRLAEERAKHEETVKHVQEASVGNLRVGLMPIFEALGSFSLETLKGYEGVRIINGSRINLISRSLLLAHVENFATYLVLCCSLLCSGVMNNNPSHCPPMSNNATTRSWSEHIYNEVLGRSFGIGRLFHQLDDFSSV